MLLKSKWFWTSAVLILCAAIYFAFMHPQTNQPQKVIRIYKPIDIGQRDTSQAPENRPAPTPVSDEGVEKSTPAADVESADISADTAHRTNTFADTANESPETEQPRPGTEEAPVEEVNTYAATEAEAARAAEKIAELRIEIRQALQDRSDLWDLIYDLAEFGEGEPYELRKQLVKEVRELRKTIITMCGEYMGYTLSSADFGPGGEFYDLMKKNHMGIGNHSE